MQLIRAVVTLSPLRKTAFLNKRGFASERNFTVSREKKSSAVTYGKSHYLTILVIFCGRKIVSLSSSSAYFIYYKLASDIYFSYIFYNYNKFV